MPDKAVSPCGSSRSSPASGASGTSLKILSSDDPDLSTSSSLNSPKPSKGSEPVLKSVSSKSVLKSKELSPSSGVCSEVSRSAVSETSASSPDILSKLKEERNASMSEVSGIPSSSTGYASPETTSGSSGLALNRPD